MTIKVGTGTKGSRFLKTDWPIDEGLTAGTTKLPEKPNLEAEETVVPESEHWGSL
jgi:hypothetical protein